MLLLCSPVAPGQEIKFAEWEKVEEVGGACQASAEKKKKPVGSGTKFQGAGVRLHVPALRYRPLWLWAS